MSVCVSMVACRLCVHISATSSFKKKLKLPNNVAYFFLPRDKSVVDGVGLN